MKQRGQKHTEVSLLTVLICKMGIVIILPLPTSWVIVKVRGDEAFVESGESVGAWYFSVQSCSFGYVFVERDTSNGPSAEMLYPGDVWRTAARMPHHLLNGLRASPLIVFFNPYLARQVVARPVLSSSKSHAYSSL